MKLATLFLALLLAKEPPAAATLIVTCHPGAFIAFEGKMTASSGSHRRFETKPFHGLGHLTLTITGPDGAREMLVKVEAGKTITLDLRREP